MYPDSIKSLIESFKFLPGIGEKTAERLAFSVLELDEEQVQMFSESLLEINKKIHKPKKQTTIWTRRKKPSFPFAVLILNGWLYRL